MLHYKINVVLNKSMWHYEIRVTCKGVLLTPFIYFYILAKLYIIYIIASFIYFIAIFIHLFILVYILILYIYIYI